MLICAVKDSAIDAFMNPFATQAAGSAIRAFRDEVNRSGADNAMNKHPEDYDLYELGTYDEQTGLIVPNPPRLLVRGKDCLIPTI